MGHNRDMDADQILLCKISGELEITEMELFQKAYLHWHHVEGDEKALENIYGQVMMSRIPTPFWVRDFCRRVEDAIEDGDVRALWDLIRHA